LTRSCLLMICASYTLEAVMKVENTIGVLICGAGAAGLTACNPSGRAGRLLAGDRAPDAPLRGAAGCSRRLFELFAGPHWTLIGLDTTHDIVAARRGLHIHRVGAGCELEDEGGHFRDAYGLAPGEWVLVRPDGYVAATVTADLADPLESFFAEVGLSGRSPLRA
jgi:hypothetical protein